MRESYYPIITNVLQWGCQTILLGKSNGRYGTLYEYIKQLDDFCKSNSAQLAENHSFFTFSSMEFFMHMNKLIPCCTIVKGFIFDLVPVSLVDLEPESS